MLKQKSDFPKPTVAQSSSFEETVDKLLADEKIKEIIEKNQFLKDKIRRAAEMLVNTLDPKSALLVATKAIRKDKINVFVSYKKQDEDAARTVVRELRKYG